MTHKAGMRILFVVPYTPNPIRTRPYNFIRHLARHGHDVTVLTIVENEDEEADARALSAHSTVIAVPLSRWRSLLNCVLALPSRRPLQSVYSWQPALMRQLEGLTNGQAGNDAFDIVHVEHLRGARYGLALKAKGKGKPPIVWDSVDCISHLFRQAASQSRSRFGRIVTRLELARTAHFEAKLPSVFDQTLVTSEADRRALLDLNSQRSLPAIQVLPNGVDLEYFTPPEEENREAATLVVSGKMSYHANVTMVLNLVAEIMPRVWAQQPQVQLWVVGKDPGSEIQALAQNPKITVTGTVSDIRPYLRRATISVAPLAYGAGIQNKVLEAMACGTPVVASPQGVEALAITPERDLVLASDSGSFADAIVELLARPERQEELGESGRSYVEAHHSWLRIAARLGRIYEGVCRTHAREAQFERA